MNVVSLNVGKPAPLQHGRKTVLSAIRKQPVSEPLYVTKTGFKEDGQADLVHHGGEDKAICMYAAQHYSFWEQQCQQPFPVPSFGENLTVSGLSEKDVHIGNVFQIGEAVVQVSQPRQPCFKLAALHHIPDLVVQVNDTGFTGWYVRVLKEGWIGQGDTIVQLEKDPSEISIAEANRIMNTPTAAVDSLLALDALAESWKAPLRKRTEVTW